MNVNLNVLPNSVTTKVGQCSTTKALWENLYNMYSMKKSSQNVIENSDHPKYDEELFP